MSVEVTTQTKEPEIHVFYSAVAELLALVNVLADNKHHAAAREETEELSGCLSAGSEAFLEKVAGLPYQGIEFFELLLDCRIFHDPDGFAAAVQAYDNRRFIRILTGEELEDKLIDQLVADRQALPRWLQDLPWVYRGRDDVFESLLYETQTFKNDLTVLLREIGKLFFSGMEPHLEEKYKAAVDSLRDSLSGRSAYDVAEQIMNRRITPDDSVRELFFLPSYYIAPHYVMAYNRSARMFLFDMRRENSGAGQSRRKLSAALKVLSDETRLEILRLLILQPTYGKLLADRLHLTTATISHHLDVLRSARLIRESKEGNIKYFIANEEEIQWLMQSLNDFLYNK
ncbi:ArsR/SmtB family transcription factor [Ethanoligenens harbinense]|uniref:Regulatory protein ArsR n=1 Tax=Ethanoligenens harbinense (strain DSM 18485 / JCM 12961 / CGMCC 1.5033 / YUAN-3) TaxID=663278 RepID=E6U4H7_ETHHY|nr:metalloregulator ArsR/SmtB family transcription factor [Ethanoligenens harbinense]ADU27784.1 regulatory protein ArsR [Ethanoligenens harbinense YUAN-3]AVQ96808.1 transcriptional regulator [Ethanoligenens harbinense YUAN-3]AYF39470.1 transcriptional regulator [Ethanoligenens harbinense]AYF42295.1 transcriptional regulator [Ethanoligenens harbinense]QCN93049.1 transcriptional regulator [Ethanoligenens harbinense]